MSDIVRELAEHRVKAEAGGWLPEFEAIASILVAAQQQSDKRITALAAVGRALGWKDATEPQLLLAAQAVATLKTKAAQPAGTDAEYLRGFITGHLEALCDDVPEFATAADAARHLATLHRAKCEKREAK
jgi:hypothetical protein